MSTPPPVCLVRRTAYPHPHPHTGFLPPPPPPKREYHKPRRQKYHSLPDPLELVVKDVEAIGCMLSPPYCMYHWMLMRAPAMPTLLRSLTYIDAASSRTQNIEDGVSSSSASGYVRLRSTERRTALATLKRTALPLQGDSQALLLSTACWWLLQLRWKHLSGLSTKQNQAELGSPTVPNDSLVWR